jgi:hypothetical protein
VVERFHLGASVAQRGAAAKKSDFGDDAFRGSRATSLGRSAMPVVLREGPYRVCIYAYERGEPPHVHVWRDRNQAKFWLRPVSLADGGRFKPVELRRIERILSVSAARLLEEWHARHG